MRSATLNPKPILAIARVARIVLATAALTAAVGCAQTEPRVLDPLRPASEASAARAPAPQTPSSADSTEALIAHLRGVLEYDEDDPRPADAPLFAGAWRARAIDLLADRGAQEAIPALIECLSDFRALNGSDNWVGGHAANALVILTGRPFSLDQAQWRAWWADRARRR